MPMSRVFCRLVLLAAALSALPFAGSAAPNGQDGTRDLLRSTITAPTPPDGLHDYDFLIGSWQAHLSKRLRPLTGSEEWVEYNGTSTTRKIWDDRANTEEFDATTTSDKVGDRKNIHAQVLRLYNPETREWSIYGINAAKGSLDMPATVGHFTDGVGRLYDHELFDGRWILVRYEWTSQPPTKARIVQSFSADGGKNWEANWICDLTRDKP
jgi:hypothetical protein